MDEGRGIPRRWYDDFQLTLHHNNCYEYYDTCYYSHVYICALTKLWATYCACLGDKAIMANENGGRLVSSRSATIISYYMTTVTVAHPCWYRQQQTTVHSKLTAQFCKLLAISTIHWNIRRCCNACTWGVRRHSDDSIGHVNFVDTLYLPIRLYI